MSETADSSASDAASDEATSPRRRRRRRLRWRLWLRAFHRDIGYLIIGLTFVYAISGLAVNHIEDWNPNFDVSREELVLDEVPQSTDAAVDVVLAALEIKSTPESVYRSSPDQIDVVVDEHRTLHIDPVANRVLDERREPRTFLRAANWLHLNRGKQAWTVVADAYAILLLFLATSGLFMVRGSRGVLGRGWVFVAIGVAVPVLYVTMSGGP